MIKTASQHRFQKRAADLAELRSFDPCFSPQLAHLCSHAFIVEHCDHTSQGVRKQQRCLRLHDDLQHRIVYFDERFHRIRQCVRRTREVNAELVSDSRECQLVQEGAGARRLAGGC